MARPTRKGFDYFPFEKIIFEDRKIKRLMIKYPLSGIGLYIYIASQVYYIEGYYIHFDDDDIFDLADGIRVSNESIIREMVNFCGSIGLFDEKLLKTQSIITSLAFQTMYLTLCKDCRRQWTYIKPEYNLTNYSFKIISESESIILEKNTINSEENRVNSDKTIVNPEETLIDSRKSTQSKVKESKPNQTKSNDISFSSKRDRLLEIFLIEKNYPESEMQKFINHYDKTEWMDGNKNKIKNKYAAARNWAQIGTTTTYCPSQLHERWKKVWEVYKDSVGMQEASILFNIKPSLNGNILMFHCNLATYNHCEDDLYVNNLRLAVRQGFGNNIKVEYDVYDANDRNKTA